MWISVVEGMERLQGSTQLTQHSQHHYHLLALALIVESDRKMEANRHIPSCSAVQEK